MNEERTSMMTATWRGVAAMAIAATVAGCSALDLGPEPSNYVGSRPDGAHAMTDPELSAVKPESPVAAVIPATMAGGVALPETMPAATQPTTTEPTTATNPATLPSLGEGAATQPAGKVEIPHAITVQDAILIGLQNNTALRVQRYNVPLQRTGEEIQRAAFDPTIAASIAGGRSAQPNGTGGTTYTDEINAQIAATEFLPTGTTINVGYTTNNSFYSDAASSSGLSTTVTQALLRGAGLDVNLASLRQSQIDTKITQYELRGFAEALISDIEQAYWDLAFAERQVVIVQNALEVADEQLRSATVSIKVGRISPTEQAAAEAEVALRREDLINAKSILETNRLRLLQLITPARQPFWNRTIALHSLPFIPTGKMDPVEKHAEVALRMRPEINETRLRIQRGDLQVVKTKNGLLPQLDLFVTLGQTGFANSFGASITSLNGPDYNALVGVRGSYTIGNRAESAAHRAAVLSKEQTEDSLDNLIQTVQVDVRTQYIEVERSRQQIDATRVTRMAQETAFKVEQGKFRVGNSTSLLVAQAQRDLLTAQLSEVRALTNHLKALVVLYRFEGSLLYRRGIQAPGGEAVKAEAWRR